MSRHQSQTLASSSTLAHELGHACWLVDSYHWPNASSEIREQWMPMDWGNGFYPPGLTQGNMINRLLMYGVDNDSSSAQTIDIPRGSVWGAPEATGMENVVPGDRAVGLRNLNRVPRN